MSKVEVGDRATVEVIISQVEGNGVCAVYTPSHSMAGWIRDVDLINIKKKLKVGDMVKYNGSETRVLAIYNDDVWIVSSAGSGRPYTSTLKNIGY